MIFPWAMISSNWKLDRITVLDFEDYMVQHVAVLEFEIGLNESPYHTKNWSKF